MPKRETPSKNPQQHLRQTRDLFDRVCRRTLQLIADLLLFNFLVLVLLLFSLFLFFFLLLFCCFLIV